MTKRAAAVGSMVLVGTISFVSVARAEDPARPWEQNPVAFGAHAGIAVPQAFGSARPGLASRFGIAPTGALEMSFRVADHFSVGGLVAAGLGTGEGCSNVESSKSCQVPVLALLSGFVRYHLVPSGKFEPWVGLGFAGSVLNGPSPGLTGPLQTSSGKGTLDRISTTEAGVELLVGAGGSWRVNPNTSVGFAFQSFVGPNTYARETRKYSQGAEQTRALPLTGINGIFLLSLHLQFHTPN